MPNWLRLIWLAGTAARHSLEREQEPRIAHLTTTNDTLQQVSESVTNQIAAQNFLNSLDCYLDPRGRVPDETPADRADTSSGVMNQQSDIDAHKLSHTSQLADIPIHVADTLEGGI